MKSPESGLGLPSNNSLGSLENVPAAGKSESENAEGKELKEATIAKYAESFKEEYDAAIKFRDFTRGWNEFEDKNAGQFSRLITDITEISINSVQEKLISGGVIDPDRTKRIKGFVKVAVKKIAQFEVKNGSPLVSKLIGIIEELDTCLETSMTRENMLKILVLATSLRSYYRALEDSNNAFLEKQK